MLDWSRFESLAGSMADNFEQLCRSIVRRQFGGDGVLHERKNQPGVEYYIELNCNNQLGKINESVGWQCKWFTYQKNGNLTASGKKQITESLQKTSEHVSDLKHWILWTQKTLTKADQEWFYGLKKSCTYELHLWDESDLESLLVGSALDIKYTYFGELALTPKMLSEQHLISIEPIKKRWISEVNQKVNVESEVRKILGELSAWDEIHQAKQQLDNILVIINENKEKPCYQNWDAALSNLISIVENFIDLCTQFEYPITETLLSQIHTISTSSGYESSLDVQKLLSLFRRKNLVLSLYITNTLALIRDIKMLFSDAYEKLSQQFVAVIANAGGGKTQLAAEITSANSNRPAGIFILGRSLHKNASLDTLAQQFHFYHQQVSSFEKLIAALNSAAIRSNCRLPIVIDGLNEAEDPREWKVLLSTAIAVLKKYPNVVLICTLRTGELKLSQQRHTIQKRNQQRESREIFARQTLPENCYTLESEGFGQLTSKAIKAYFDYYKIQADLYMVPIEFFNHPLNLKIFCEVTNRERKELITIKYFPSSIYSLFKQHINHSVINILNLKNLPYQYNEHDINGAIYTLGQCLWNSSQRSIDEKTFLETLESKFHAHWDGNIINLLVQEGLLFRDTGNEPYSFILTPVYDLLGGFLIADYLILSNKNNSPEQWFKDKDFLNKIFGEIPLQHELAEDILHSLVAMLPKNAHQQQVWKMLPEEYQEKVLLLSYLIDIDDFDSDTKDAYKQLLLNNMASNSHQIFRRLWELRTLIDHPLNANFLDELLRDLSVTDRDLSWTEYNRVELVDNIKIAKNSINYWTRRGINNHDVERLRAIWLSWFLTSTSIELRDLVTQALVAYGEHEPEVLFNLTLKALDINDLYVPERLLAASYAVVIMKLGERKIDTIITNFALKLYEVMFSADAKYATTHILMRNYASYIIQAVNKSIPEVFSPEHLKAASSPFPKMPRLQWKNALVSRTSEKYGSPLHMDFENYTIGRLVHKRSNYDYDHPEYKDVLSKILWRIEQIGWDDDKYKDTDDNIARIQSHSRGYGAKVERYGKKYSWIAYYEIAGQREDENKLHPWGSRFVADIDPFFPQKIVNINIDKNEYLGNSTQLTENWILKETKPDLSSLLVKENIQEESDSWLCINGYIEEESRRLDRNFFCAIKSYFIQNDKVDKLLQQQQKSESIEYPEIPTFYNAYSGELYLNHDIQLSMNDNKIQWITGYKKSKEKIPTVIFDEETFKTTRGPSRYIKEPQYEVIRAYQPIISYGWESCGISESNFSQNLLSPWLFNSLNLIFNPRTLSYTDKTGNSVVKIIKIEGTINHNKQSLIYIKKELVQDILEKQKLKLIYIITGERRLALVDHFHETASKKVKYKEFSIITSFDS